MAEPARVSLPVSDELPPGWGVAEVRFSIAGRLFQARIEAPAGPVRGVELLAIFQRVAESVIGVAVQEAEAEGRRISCRAGCGACCRQLVPISEIEARRLAALVEALPEPRRSEVRARFADAVRRLDAAGVGAKIRRPDSHPDAGLRAIGLEYFSVGVACPFLEQESCSIHPDRPIACREYLVTSPAEHCARPTAETVDVVPLPGKVSTAVLRLSPPAPDSRSVSWVPLVLALEWAAAHPDEPPPRPGPEVLREFFTNLGRPAPPR
jgi:Fe-S-cluster containining protein